MIKRQIVHMITVPNPPLGLLLLLLTTWLLPARATDQITGSDRYAMVSIVKQVGSAEIRSLNPLANYDPTQQPTIYWHDADYKIDLQLPYREQQPYKITILPRVGQRKEVEVTSESDGLGFGEIVSITRGPGNKAVVIAHSDATVDGFSIIDLKTGRLLDTVYGYALSMSPNARFVVFEDLYPPNSTNVIETHTRLYDVLKSPRANVACNYDKLDQWRGQPIYPVKANEICRPSEDPDPDAGSESFHTGLSDSYEWSPDSSMVAFADTQGSVMSLVLVTMPTSPNGSASTFIYTPSGQSKPCAENCTLWQPVHLTWTGDSLNTTLNFTPFGGKPQTQMLTLHKTDFSPAER